MLTEDTVEQAALDWLRSLGYTVKHGAEIAPGELTSERADYGKVVLEQRVHDALTRLNPRLPNDALNDAFRKLTLLEGVTLETRNRTFHRMLVDGIAVEYRRPDGSIAGAQVHVVDFATADENDWLAVNQFTVVDNKHTRRLDVVLFINGLPLVLIELKSAVSDDATIWSAFRQFLPIKPSCRRCLVTTRCW